MIVKILGPGASFSGVDYNTDKIESGRGELLKAANFGLLDGLGSRRPQDYKNYLKAFSARNKLVSRPQFHAVISAKGKTGSKEELLGIAERWLALMGYGSQPYLVFFHHDTANHHVHMVSTRIGSDGRKISDAFEKRRAIRFMREIMQQDAKTSHEPALQYRFSTLAQFRMILETLGLKVSLADDKPLIFRAPSRQRAVQLGAIFKKYAPLHDPASFKAFLKAMFGVDVLFHAKDGLPPYGYTVIDHAGKNAYKGSEVLPLKELMKLLDMPGPAESVESGLVNAVPFYSRPSAVVPSYDNDKATKNGFVVSISRDTDDEQIHGPRRRRKRKVRSNTR